MKVSSLHRLSYVHNNRLDHRLPQGGLLGGCGAAVLHGSVAWCILVRDPVLVDMAPKMSGTLYGITDLFYSAGGFAVPIICDTLVDDYGVSRQWRPVWICIIGCNVAWIILYVGFCKSEESQFSVKF